MRKPMLAGNWKMNLGSRDEALQFVYAVNDKLPASIDCVICAPAIVLRDLVKRQGDVLRIGGQNMHEKDSGAYTGEVSGVMLKACGVEYVIIGHSERRQYFNETDASVNAKVKKALEVGLKPIVCVGESLAQREANETNDVLHAQITADLAGLTEEELANVVIAYEPIWAIGTGKVASADMADEACGFIRNEVKNLYSSKTADEIRVLYGGSVSMKSIDELMAKPNIDGGLVGGASLVADSFVALCNAATKYIA